MRRRALLLALLLLPHPGRAGDRGPPPVRYGEERDPSAGPLDRAVLDAVRARLGGSVQPSPALSAAARALAARVADGEREPLGRAAVRLALVGAGAFDPSPVTVAVSDAPHRLAERIASALRGRDFTHAGVGAVEGAAGAHAVAILARRAVRLDPFPREVAAGAAAALRGRLAGLSSPRVLVTGPDGEVREVPAGGGEAFEARLAFEGPGRFVVEVLGTGARGPEVAALLVISAGGAPLGEAPRAAAGPDPARDDEAEARVAGAVNALRARRGLPRLDGSERLREVARRHSADMLAGGTLAHVLREGAGVGERLRRARVPFRRALENLAKGATALAAHESIEESPAHLASLLDRDVTSLGVGIARGRLPTGEPIVYLTEILVQPVDDSSEGRLRPEERVRQSLWRERERLGLPSLLADPILDGLAAQAAEAMLRAGDPGEGDCASRALALGRKVAAADAFVAAAPGDAVRSRNLPSPRFRRVGVGVAVGDAPGYGAGLLWIAVVYSD